MNPLLNLLWLPVRYLLVLLGGLVDLLGLARLLAAALPGNPATLGARAAAVLTSPAGLRRAVGVLRVFWSNLVLKRRLVSAYANTGTVLVTRHADVLEVIAREPDFAVVYEPRMRRVTDGENFFLGMQDGPAYQHDVSLMRLAARQTDVADIILPCIETDAAAVVAATLGTDGGRLDVPAQLTLPVIARMVRRWFGLPDPGAGPTDGELIDWTTTLFWYLFSDLGADPAVEQRALAAAGGLRAALDAAIAARKAQPTDADDVLGRCLDLQRAAGLGLTDRAIRDNLLGLIIGAVPTLSQATVRALDELLDRPAALAGASAAARAGDLDALGRYCLEALRFNPPAPLVYRRAVRECVIAAGTPRARRIPQDSMVLAITLGAMHDPWAVAQPRAFRTDRPAADYLLWGLGLHTCFGRHVNRAAIPALLRPLLAAGDLRRAAGPAGRIDTAGTPYPVHFVVERGRLG